MISYRGREGKRGRSLKMTKNIERLYKEGKCRDCSVVVTRMDFAKILGKFTKVKIQYESTSSKAQKTSLTNKTGSSVANPRLKNNENGMVQFHRKAYNPHPARDLINTRRNTNVNKLASPQRQTSTNILKEINALNNTNSVINRSANYNKIHSNGKQYVIIFNNPTSKHNNNNVHCELTLSDLLPKVNNDILPSDEWCIDYFPKKDEPKNDKVYDRIAAELEDLMYNEKPDTKIKQEASENKVDEFPSIMDILNDNTTPQNNSESKDQNSTLEFKDNVESNDVEAMLLGKTNNMKKETPMDVDNTDVNKLIADVVQFSTDTDNTESITKEPQNMTELDNPHSPSILDETLQKGIEEHLPIQPKDKSDSIEKNNKDNIINVQISDEITPKNGKQSSNFNFPSTLKLESVTHVVFKKVVDGKCIKSVTCPRNLKYSIELEDKSVEFLGAPKYISNSDDLQVLLQIVNETNLTSLYVLY